jgi:hypothetical protein
MAMEKLEGIPRDVALKKIWLRDSKGLIVKDRPTGGISHHKADFAHEHRYRHKFLHSKDDIFKHHVCFCSENVNFDTNHHRVHILL